MTSGWIGVLLGLAVGLGVVFAVRSSPPMRRPTLVDRIAPYLSDAPAPSRLLQRDESNVTSLLVVRRVIGPVASDAVRWIDRLVGGAESVRRRLGGLGTRASCSSVEEFRVEQVVWGAIGMAAGALSACVGAVATGRIDPIMVILVALAGGVAGVLGRDWWLTRQLERRERSMLAEFPVIADLLALSVTAGEAPVDAIRRVCGLTRGELASELQSALDDARSGTAITSALSALARRTTLDPLSRFVEGMIVAIERGTPVAEVLRAQAVDVRELSKRALLDASGRKEVQMMVPVVFLILPVTVLFALYPGLLTLTSLSS